MPHEKRAGDTTTMHTEHIQRLHSLTGSYLSPVPQHTSQTYQCSIGASPASHTHGKVWKQMFNIACIYAQRHEWLPEANLVPKAHVHPLRSLQRNTNVAHGTNAGLGRTPRLSCSAFDGHLRLSLHRTLRANGFRSGSSLQGKPLARPGLATNALDDSYVSKP